MKQFLYTTLNQKILLQKGLRIPDHTGGYSLNWQNQCEIWSKIHQQQRVYHLNDKYILDEAQYIIVTKTHSIQFLDQYHMPLRLQYKNRKFMVSKITYYGARCAIKANEVM